MGVSSGPQLFSMTDSAVILDVDGTLVDSNDPHARAWVDAFAEAGVEVSFDRVRRAIGMGGDKLLPHVSGISKESPQGERIDARRREIFKSRYLPTVQPFPRVRELVERFARDGFRLVVASSASEDDLRPLLDRAGVADLIQARTSSDDAENSKPDPDIVWAALKRSRAPSNAAIMLGDTPYDVEAALGARIRVVGLESGGWRREELKGAAEVYASAAELCDRYETSIFARVARGFDRRSHDARGASLLWFAAPLFVIAGVVIAGAVSQGQHRRKRAGQVRGRERFDRVGEEGSSPIEPIAEPESRHTERPALSRRDRERLRRVISRTS